MKIFLSHVSNEGLLALVLKEWIQTVSKKRLKVFVSSDIQNIAAGDRWLENLRDALTDARLLIVLCSPYSITRPWVNFETGSGWIKDIPVIPICHSGQRLGNLPSPLSLFQGLDMHSSDFPIRLMQNLKLSAKLRKPLRINKKGKTKMMKEIRSALRKIKTNTPAQATSPIQDRVALVLKKIAISNNEDCTCEKLAVSLQMDTNDLDIYLRHLMDRRFIRKKTENNGDCWYTTTKNGREFLVQQDISARSS